MQKLKHNIVQDRICTLIHGSPKKVEVGEYLDPSYCGMWENCQTINPANGKEENALFFFLLDDGGNNSFNYESMRHALFYARREIYAPSNMDTTKNTRTIYFLFEKPDTTLYIYTVQMPFSKLSDMYGKYLEKDKKAGEVICFEPVKVLKRQDFDIQRILEWYSKKEESNAVARVLEEKKSDMGYPFFSEREGHLVYPSTFGARGGIGISHIDSKELLRDLKRYTKPAPKIKKCVFEQEEKQKS